MLNKNVRRRTSIWKEFYKLKKALLPPLLFSTYGGMGIEATKFVKRIGELISIKRNEDYADVINYLRTRLRFTILRSTLYSDTWG